MKVIDYKNVDILQEELVILKDVNFSVNPSEMIYLCGKVGSGKSTLLKSFYAEVPVQNGEASVFSFNMRKLKNKEVPALRRRMGIIFQDFRLLSDRSVFENLDFVLKTTGWKDKKQRAEQIDLVLSTVGLNKKSYKRPHQLSGGEQQRVAIARALLNSPELIIADEPTGNLDLETSTELISLLYEISKSGTSVIVATHNTSLVEQFPGRVFNCDDETLIERL